ncbi:MAG: hypothetical protein H0X63_06725 [Flavobacteriales bacterium]|nr:hypothetical protein [Flavobacteriales bacterium]
MKTKILFHSVIVTVMFSIVTSCKKNDDLFQNQENHSTSIHHNESCPTEDVYNYLISNNYSEIQLNFNSFCDTAVANTSFPYLTEVYLSRGSIIGHKDDCSIYTSDVTVYLTNLEYIVYTVDFPANCDTAIATTHNPYQTAVFLRGGNIVGVLDMPN